MQNWSTNYADHADSDRASMVESVSTDATADDLPGPGRTLGNLYGFLGKHLENLLNQLAEEMGRGPRVTAIRIQKHRRAIATSSIQPMIRTDSKKVQRDCKRLIGYVGSGVASTRRQALDHIIDFSVSDRYVRDLLKELDAIPTIERIRKHPTVWLDFDDSLLQRSRKALVALSDVKVNVIAKRVATLPEVVHCYNCSRMAVLSTFEDLTCHLHDHDNSFLVVRHFSQITQLDATRKLLGLGTPIMLKHLADFLVDYPDDLEWECIDRLFNDLLEETMKPSPCVYLGDVYCDDMIKTILLYADRLSRTVDSMSFKWFTEFDSTDDIGVDKHAFITYQLLKSIVSTGGINDISHIKLERLQELYPAPSLRSLFLRLSCPSNLTLCRIVIERKSTSDAVFYDPTQRAKYIDPQRLAELCQELVSYLEQATGLSLNYALHAVKVLLVLDTYCRAAIMRALSSTKLACSSEFPTLFRETENTFNPWSVEDVVRSSRKIYKHCDLAGNLVHIHNVMEKCISSPVCKTAYVLEHDTIGILQLHVPCGTAFSSEGHHALLAGYTPDGKPAYIAYEATHRKYLAVSEGTRPESLLLQSRRFDRMNGTGFCTKEYTPNSFDVLVLRYAPDVYNHITWITKGTEEESSDRVGPYAWRPVDPNHFLAPKLKIQVDGLSV